MLCDSLSFVGKRGMQYLFKFPLISNKIESSYLQDATFCFAYKCLPFMIIYFLFHQSKQTLITALRGKIFFQRVFHEYCTSWFSRRFSKKFSEPWILIKEIENESRLNLSSYFKIHNIINHEFIIPSVCTRFFWQLQSS